MPGRPPGRRLAGGGGPISVDHALHRFRDRGDAGEELGRHLGASRGRPDLLVLGLPRGGVPVAARVARALEAPLDVLVVRKLGVPGHEELGMGAIASGGVRLVNREVIGALGIQEDAIERVVRREAAELYRRERAYRGDRPPLDPTGRVVVLIDDGLATGSSMRAAVEALRWGRPAAVVVAVPVAPASTCRALEPLVTRLVCLVRARTFLAVGQWYDDFTPTTDDEVRALLRESEPGDGAPRSPLRAGRGPARTPPGSDRSPR